MNLIDTHSHIYSEEFDDDLPEVIERARLAGVTRIYLPNVDSTTLERMLRVCRDYKGYCYPMIGLHPTSVNENYEKELAIVEQQLAASDEYVAVGEVGIDLYWDKTFLKEQIYAFDLQIQWALKYDLPLVIHSRDAFEQINEVMRPYKDSSLRGIFHSFTGTVKEAELLLEYDKFLLGINGVVTFKNSVLPETLKSVSLERIVLETDAPYLTPVPYRGKRNESAHLKYTLMKVADIYMQSPEFIAEQTSANVLKVFGLPRKQG
ncbi:TatD family hydrolase [Bacteroides sp. 51]|uniref:TatD family hydrolase n=1 Tax=Bacteroides sp. 51 TaxID=2302938 RepID=UPI0013D550B7|nr:TatD family hydrolase [Bacteroides sp. 51]NDV82422.1 TatD family deoxyribonuclease [Bacteroides sp. 51]